MPPEMLRMMLVQLVGTPEGRESATDSIALFLTEMGIEGITLRDPESKHPDMLTHKSRREAAVHIVTRLVALADAE